MTDFRLVEGRVFTEGVVITILLLRNYFSSALIYSKKTTKQCRKRVTLILIELKDE